MSQPPLNVKTKALQTPRERVWAAIQTHAVGTEWFTRISLQDRCNPMVPITVLEDYLPGLVKAGYLAERTSKKGNVAYAAEYARTELRSADAPQVGRDGSPSQAGLGVEAMWRAMKVMKSFTHDELAQAATLGPVVVKPATAKSYVNALARAGYLAQVSPPKPGRAARYRLLLNTGAKPPAITRTKVVFDRNTGQVHAAVAAQEVCDGIE